LFVLLRAEYNLISHRLRRLAHQFYQSLDILLMLALRVDIVPLGPLSSPATLVSEFALAGLFAASALLV
jgi:hypothetical protein